MSFIHPLTALSFGTAALPPDLALESADALSTYRALVQFSQSLSGLDVTPLDPAAFFPSSVLLAQKDVLRYEAALKDALKPLLASSDVQDSSSGMKGVVDSLSAPTLATTDIDILNTPPDSKLLRESLIHLLCDLKSTGDLVRILIQLSSRIGTKQCCIACSTL